MIVALVPVLVLSACSSGTGTTARPTPVTLSPTLSPPPTPSGTPGATTTASAAATTAAPASRTSSPLPSPTATPARTAPPAPRRTASATAPAPTTASPTRAPRTYAVDMVTGNRFVPDALTLRSGDAVLVTNEDLVAHDFTIEELGVESGEMNQGDTFRRAFAALGTYTFVCTRHPTMDGTLTVVR